MRKTTRRSRVLAFILTFAMIFQQAGITTFADDSTQTAAATTVETTADEAGEGTAAASTDETTAQTSAAAETQAETTATEAPAETAATADTEAETVATVDTEAETPAAGETVSTDTEATTEASADETEEVTTEEETEVLTEALTEEDQTEELTEDTTEAETEAVEETEEAEAESETETEAPKTSFTYSDSRVVITATASEAANLPQDAELKADYITPGSAAYNDAVSKIESQLGSSLGMNDENTETAYVLYDVYFLSNGEEVEPEAGTVSVSMVFRQAVNLGIEGEIINTEVVHVKDNGVAEVVTDYVNVNANGDVTAMGFTQDSFSVTGSTVTYNKTQTSDGTTNNNNLITGISGYYYLNSGATKVELDGSTVIPSSVSTLYIKLNFAFAANTLTVDNPVLVFDVSELCDLGSFVTTESGNVYNSSGDIVGTYSITAAGIITITYDTSKIDVTGNVTGYVDFGFTVYDSVKESGSEVHYSIGNSSLEFQYDISDLSVKKEGDVSSDNSTVTYTITVSSEHGTTEDVILTDYLPSGVSKITSVTATKNGASYTIKENNTSGTTLSLILDEMNANDTYVITVVGTVTSDNDYTNNGISYTTLSNTATATSGNASAQGYCDLKVERKHISKSGSYDETTGLITWTILINEAGENITGYTLTDTLPSSSAKLYYLNSSTGAYVYLKEIDLTSGFVFNDANTGLSNSGTYTYKIEYTTDPGAPVNDTTVSNKAYLTPPIGGGGTTYGSEEETVPVPGTSSKLPYKIEEKTAESTTTDSTTGYPVIDWTVKIVVDTTSTNYTAGDDVVLPAGIEISDSMSSSSMYMTKSQLAALSLTDGTNTYNYTITYVKTSDGKEYTGADILSQLDSSARIISFKLVTNTAITLTASTTLKMTYSTLLTATASGTYYNTVNVGSKSKTGGYTYTSEKTVKKYAVDKNGTPLTSDVNYYEANGILYWMIAIEGGFAKGDSVTIKDKLPEGMTYYADAFTNGYAMYAGDTIENKYDQDFATVSIVSDNDSPETLTITITADKNWAISTTAYLVFAVKIDDWDTTSYTKGSSGAYYREYINTIGYTDGNSKTTTDSATQTVTIPDLYKSGVVAVENNETTITYTLNVNTNAYTLGSSGTITLTDVLKRNSGSCEIELDNSSITVYDVANNKTLDSTEYGCSISTDDSGTTTITLTLNDATAYTITYKYVVKATNPEQLTFSVSNNASISTNISVQDSEQGQAQKSSAVSDSTGISIHKVAKGHNNVNIEGAKFDLYKYDSKENDFVKVASYTTSSTGKVSIADASEYYVLYKLVETYAPDGYDIWTEPLYFYVTSSSATSTTVVGESALPSGTTAIAYADGSVIQLEDAIATGGTLQITKAVTGTEEGSGEYTVKITSETATAQWSKVYGIVDGKVLTTAEIYDNANTSTQIGISFTIKAGQTAVLCELTEGITYTIVEEANGATYTATYTYKTSGSTAPTVTFTDETTESITITNAFETKTGALKITKAVVADADTADELENAGTTYTITVKADAHTANTPVNLTAVDVTAVDANGDTDTAPTPNTSVAGQLTFTIKAGQTVTLSKLPVGSYTVSEASGSYTTTYKVGSSSTATATVSTSSTPEVTVTNTYPVLAEINVQKTYKGSNGSWPTDGFEFELEALESIAADGTTVIVAADVPMPAAAGNDTTLKKSVTNSDATGFGEISFKTLGTYYYKVSEVIPSEAQNNYNRYDGIEYDAAVYYVKVEVTETSGVRTATVSYLNASDMNTGETYKTATSYNNTATAASFTNNALGTLTVQKIESGDTAQADGSGYTVTVTPKTSTTNLQGVDVSGYMTGTTPDVTSSSITFIVAAGETVTLSNLPYDTYTVTETAGNYTTTYQVNSKDAQTTAPDVVINSTETQAVVITNIYTALEVSKKVSGATAASNGYEVTVTTTTGEDLKNVAVGGTKVGSDALSADGKTITLTVKDGTSVKLTNLPIATYTVTETIANNSDQTGYTLKTTYTVNKVEGDEAKAALTEENGYSGTVVITNAYTTKTTKISVTKNWEDANDQDGIRPKSVEVTLYKTVNSDKTVYGTATLNEATSWTAVWRDLPVKDASGNDITYSVDETSVLSGYTKSVSDGTVTAEGTSYIITNTHTPEITSVSGAKTWVDNNDASGKRPGSITIRLYADGTEVQSKTVTESDGWSWTFENLDKYSNGTEIKYTITEDAVTGYTAKVDGYNVTNTLNTGSLTVAKTVAGSVVNSTKEFTFTVTLSDKTLNGTFGNMTFKDGVATFSLKHGESRTATGLPAGTTYTVTEDSYTEDGYVTTATGTTGTIVKDETQTAAVTNTITSVKISKVDVTTEEELPGATIQIVDEDGDVVDKWTSTDQPHEVTGLVPGETYTLVETVAPDGYEVTTNTTFTLDENGDIDTSKTTTTISDKGVLLVEDSKTSVKISKVDVTTEEELPGATIQIEDEDGNVVVKPWVSTDQPHEVTGLTTGKTYTLVETVAPDGYEVTTNTTFILNADGTINTENTTATISDEGVLLVEDQMITSETAEISVTKKLQLDNGDSLIAKDQTFYVGLYVDAACTNLFDMEAIAFKGVSSSTVNFTGLEVGRTYYIAECDEDGVALTSGYALLADGTKYMPNFSDGSTTASVTAEDESQKTMTFTNVFYSVPDGFYKEAILTITKKLLGADGAALTSNDAVFYAGIYADASYTTLATNVDQNIVTLALAGGSEVSAEVSVSLEDGETVTLYVTEVQLDENGNPVPVANVEGFQYTWSQDTTEVTLSGENLTASVTITNQEISETSEEEESSEEEETETETESEAVKTGDESPLAFYFSLMLMAAAVMLAEGIYRKKRINR